MELLSLEPLIWLSAILLLVAALRYSLVDLPMWRQALSVGLRALAIVALVLGLCRPYWLSPGEDLHVNFLVDVSDSVDPDAIDNAADRVAASIEALHPGDGWSLFAVGAEARPLDSPERLKELTAGWREGGPSGGMRGESRLAEAMLETRLAFPAGKTRRVVLMTDGRETAGALHGAIDQLAEERTDVRLARLDTLAEAEASVVSFEAASPIAYQGEVIRLRAKAAANRTMQAEARLVRDGVVESKRTITLKPGEPTPVDFDVEARSAGAARYSVEIVPEEDRFPLNNRASTAVEVRGKPRLLVLHEKPRDMRPLRRALEQQGLELDVRGRLGLPGSIEEMLAFEAIVLADLPATDLSPRQMDALKRYVIDYGGALAMLGSENSFGLGGYFKTPVEEVLPLVSRFEKEKEKPSLAMVLVIDKSGSMQGAPIALARQAAKAAAELLSLRDLIGVVGFDGQPHTISELRSAGDIDAIHGSIDSLQAGGGTYLYPAMVQARDMLETAPAKIRHMIVLSDGHTQPADHHSLAQEASDAGVTVSTVALGAADKQLLASIADIGHGRYYETDDPSNVPQIFTKETMQASKSAIKEDLYAAVRTGDHPMLSGFGEDDLPFSLGYVMTEAKPTAQLLLAAETGDPLLAVGRYGLGTGLAFTCDLTERWGGEWLAWGDCGKFWAQVIRGVLRKAYAEGLLVHAEAHGELWRIDVTRRDESGAPVGGLVWDAAVTDQYGAQTPVEVHEVGLGRYSAEVPLGGAERLSMRLLDTEFGKLKVLHWQRPYPAEYALLSKADPSLEGLAGFSPDTLREGLEPEPQREPVAPYCYFTALALLLAGVLVRRL
ncbi:von Willebrand factor type A domain protein [Pseudobythopirellula maris]|uniref:von Willebrand factor type A domain protein n=1 Tax=Pseudobythopirellula maris TaxID=2527991 RepID=A0A5C5ZT48_9BACT|nr:VWA domain-containing protein [Pseudobythopirellula maris]TWT90197.1 von Willebrand factor type A domain protein [Pseudobythopirellula maris]